MTTPPITTIKYPILLFTILFMLNGCNTAPNADRAVTGVMDHTLQLTEQQLQFLKEFAQSQPQPVYMMSTFRNRYFKDLDQKEADIYFIKQKEEQYIKELAIERELDITPTNITAIPKIKWIDEGAINACKKSSEGLWNCLQQKCATNAFFYLSLPIISNDGNYALVHINYLHQDSEKSYGGGRIFSKVNNQWKEVALLTNWGNLPKEKSQ